MDVQSQPFAVGETFLRSNKQRDKSVFGRVHTNVYRGNLPVNTLPEVLGKARYVINTLLNTPVRFGMNSIPGTRHFDNFGAPTKNTPGIYR